MLLFNRSDEKKNMNWKQLPVHVLLSTLKKLYPQLFSGKCEEKEFFLNFSFYIEV